MNGPHFRDYHLLLDEHSDQIYEMTDEIAERARKLGGTTLHSISDISAHQRLKDNNEEFVAAEQLAMRIPKVPLPAFTCFHLLSPAFTCGN
jgi:starvation-inducible DNA-binding protein